MEAEPNLFGDSDDENDIERMPNNQMQYGEEDNDEDNDNSAIRREDEAEEVPDSGEWNFVHKSSD